MRLARKEVWPDLQVGVQYGSASGPDGDRANGQPHAWREHSGLRTKPTTEDARRSNAMRAMAAADLAAMRADTRGRIAGLYADFTRSRNLQQLYLTTVLPQAEGTVTASFAAYRAGTSTS